MVERGKEAAKGEARQVGPPAKVCCGSDTSSDGS